MALRSVSAPTPRPSFPSFSAAGTAAKPTAPKTPKKHGFAKALTHHGHVGTALKAGDAKAAMHHIGHMMLAVRNAAPAGAIVSPPDGTSDSPITTADSFDNATASSAPGTSATPAPAPKRSFNRAAFGAMRK